MNSYDFINEDEITHLWIADLISGFENKDLDIQDLMPIVSNIFGENAEKIVDYSEKSKEELIHLIFENKPDELFEFLTCTYILNVIKNYEPYDEYCLQDIEFRNLNKIDLLKILREKNGIKFLRYHYDFCSIFKHKMYNEHYRSILKSIDDIEPIKLIIREFIEEDIEEKSLHGYYAQNRESCLARYEIIIKQAIEKFVNSLEYSDENYGEINYKSITCFSNYTKVWDIPTVSLYLDDCELQNNGGYFLK